MNDEKKMSATAIIDIYEEAVSLWNSLVSLWPTVDKIDNGTLTSAHSEILRATEKHIDAIFHILVPDGPHYTPFSDIYEALAAFDEEETPPPASLASRVASTNKSQFTAAGTRYMAGTGCSRTGVTQINTINGTSYLLGRQSAYVAILQECLLHLPAGYTLDVQTWSSERQEIIARLRSLCIQLDIDASWPDDLYLPDIIVALCEQAAAYAAG